MDLLETDPVTGKRTGLAATIRRAIRALEQSGVPYAVIGASALAARGLPRMTRDLDVTVLFDDAEQAFEALRDAGLDPQMPGVEVDVLVASGDPLPLLEPAPSPR